MPTQIIDNFDLNTAKPLDNRLVVGPNSFYTSKDSITYKYEGMRVWDLNDGVPYVWTGTTFSSENNVAVTGNGIENYLAKFGAASSVISSSQVFDNGTSVGIAESSPNSSYRLHVNGKIYASSGFIGDGSLITGLNATNINSGVMGIQYLQGGNSGWILTSNNASSVSYKDPSTISVGSSNQLTTTRTLWGQNFNGSQNVTGNISVGGSITNITGNIQFKNANNGILSFYWSGNTNINQNLQIPSYSNIGGTPRTLALLEQTQTFAANNTFTNFTNFQDSIQVSGTSSFKDGLDVRISQTFGSPPFVFTIKENPFNVSFSGIRVGSISSISSAFVTTGGVYSWYGDQDTKMYRLSPSAGSTQGCIVFKTNNYTQMVLGDTVGTYSTGVEHYTTPGISMMSVLDVWHVDGFNLAPQGTSWWLNTTNNVANVVSLPTSSTYNASTDYDRMIVISTGGFATASVYLETDNLSGSFWTVANLYKDSSYSLIIPAGRKWKLSMNKVGQSTVTDSGLNSSPASVGNAQSSDYSVRFISYKWGMN